MILLISIHQINLIRVRIVFNKSISITSMSYYYTIHSLDLKFKKHNNILKINSKYLNIYQKVLKGCSHHDKVLNLKPTSYCSFSTNSISYMVLYYYTNFNGGEFN